MGTNQPGRFSKIINRAKTVKIIVDATLNEMLVFNHVKVLHMIFNEYNPDWPRFAFPHGPPVLFIGGKTNPVGPFECSFYEIHIMDGIEVEKISAPLRVKVFSVGCPLYRRSISMRAEKIIADELADPEQWLEDWPDETTKVCVRTMDPETQERLEEMGVEVEVLSNKRARR